MADPILPEIATVHSDPFVPQFQTVMQPTDDVLAKRGGAKGLALYDEIRRDPHAFAVLQKRKLEVVSREWNVFEASERRLDKKAAEEVKRQLKAINFDQLTRGMMGAVLKGYAVGEIIWANVDGTWTAKAVKVKKQRRFRFTMDGELRMLTRRHSLDGEPVPPRKFIVHRHSIDDDDDDPYGVGLGNVLFWPAWFKRQALSHWLRSNEKHATPTTVAQYEGDYDKNVETRILGAIRRMANDTGVAVPATVELSLLEAQRGGGSVDHGAINRYLDELISEAVLGETLSTNSGERGARSLGEVHNQVRIAIAKADADLVCTSIRDQLVRWIVELNFPGAGIPDVWRDFSEAEDLDAKVKRDKTLTEMGYRPKDPQYVDDTYGGEWIDTKAQPAETDADQPATVSPIAGLEFADPVRVTDGSVMVEDLADQLATIAAPSIDAMIDVIRQEFAEARDFDDLTLRLSRLASEMGVDDLASVMEQAITVARLEGENA
ncbi:DUF935 domain-containing protein [Ensifer canadensis]